MKAKCTLALAGTLMLFSTGAYAQAPKPLIHPTELKGSLRESPDPTVIRSRNVVVDLALLRSAEKQTLLVPLFDGQSQEIELSRIERMEDMGTVWHGKVAKEPRSIVTLAVVNDVLMGNILKEDGRAFQIRYLGNGIHSLREIDQSKFPEEAQPIVPQKEKDIFIPMPDTCTTDPATDVDVMVVYTDDARAAAGGTDAMKATVYLAAAETNQSYVNSNVSQRLRLVHVSEVSYAETGNINTDLTQLQSTDTVIDNVLALRNTYGADHVVMITENGGGYCGLAYMMNPVANSFETHAFAVVARTCATGYFSFGHELGHNQGTDHDCLNAASTGPYTYNRGWVETTPSAGSPWRTIMSYQSSPPSTRVPYWSNPSVNYPVGSDPMGGACPTPPYSANNRLVLNNTALTAANFRCSSPGINNVWMKDTWHDSGAEPDPLTASQVMHESPYIWVRNTQDTNLVNQHRHENPEGGQPNWVYVKMHNGGTTAASGNLEIYVTNASTTLTWGAWTMIASIPVSGFAPHSTKIVETTWTPPSVVAHYCMVARWNSTADPMTWTETPSIDYNTRRNNNIVWRNMDIVNFYDQWFSQVGLLVRSTSRATATLEIRPRAGETSFIGVGQIDVTMDDRLRQLWVRGGARGTGFQVTDTGFRINAAEGARFENLELDPTFVGNLGLTFTRNEATPLGQYFIRVLQLERDRTGAEQVVGGVSYEIIAEQEPKTPKPESKP